MTVSEVWDGMSASGVGAEGTELSIRHRTRGLGSVFSSPGNLSRPFTLLHPCDLIRSILTFLMLKSWERGLSRNIHILII